MQLQPARISKGIEVPLQVTMYILNIAHTLTPNSYTGSKKLLGNPLAPSPSHATEAMHISPPYYRGSSAATPASSMGMSTLTLETMHTPNYDDISYKTCEVA
jgi:hypothetical protein